MNEPLGFQPEPRASGRTTRMINMVLEAAMKGTIKSVVIVDKNSQTAHQTWYSFKMECEERKIPYAATMGKVIIGDCTVIFEGIDSRRIGVFPDTVVFDHFAEVIMKEQWVEERRKRRGLVQLLKDLVERLGEE